MDKKEIIECCKCKQKFDLIENKAICPNCGYNNRAESKSKFGCGCLLLIMIFFFFIFIFAVSSEDKKETEQPTTTESKADEANWIIASHDYGEDYPYTEDYLTIYCYKSAVWLEDTMSNRYALNGFAMNLLKNKQNYQGTTEKILKPGKADVYLPAEAEKYCIILSDSQFKVMK